MINLIIAVDADGMFCGPCYLEADHFCRAFQASLSPAYDWNHEVPRCPECLAAERRAQELNAKSKGTESC